MTIYQLGASLAVRGAPHTENHMEKPRITLAQFRAMQQGKPTVGALIERYIGEMNGLNGQPAVRVIGESQMYAMRAMQRRPIAAVVAEELTKHHIIADAKERRLQVCPATVMHDTSNLSVVLQYAGAAWPECDDLTDAAVQAAKPFLTKHGLIGKSTPRKRRPTEAELDALLAYFETPAKRGKAREIRMPDIIAFALVSTRRLGEICRITYGDIDWQKRVYVVRDLKHPTKKRGNDKAFALWPELAQIIERQPRASDSPAERVFPFNPKSCSAAYTLAKKRLGIEGLRFHDNRREAVTLWLSKLPPHKVRQISGHETTVILERVYSAPKPEELLSEVCA